MSRWAALLVAPGGRWRWRAAASTGARGENTLARAGRGARVPSSSTVWAGAAARPVTSFCFSRARGAGLQGRHDAHDRRPARLPARLRRQLRGEDEGVRVDVAGNTLTANRLPRIEFVGDVAATLAARRESAQQATRADRPPGASSCQGRGPGSARGAGRARGPPHTAPPAPYIRGAGGAARPRRDGRGTALTSSPTRGATSTPSSRAARWTRPFGYLGAGPGQRSGQTRAPDHQVYLLLGDGAFSFSGISSTDGAPRPRGRRT